MATKFAHAPSFIGASFQSKREFQHRSFWVGLAQLHHFPFVHVLFLLLLLYVFQICSQSFKGESSSWRQQNSSIHRKIHRLPAKQEQQQQQQRSKSFPPWHRGKDLILLLFSAEQQLQLLPQMSWDRSTMINRKLLCAI